MKEGSNKKEKDLWDKWNARAYLNEYFKKLGPDVKSTTKFVADELASFRDKPITKLLEFGSGPTIIGVIGSVPYVKEIHVSDYLKSNLQEIQLWLKGDKNAFDNNGMIAYTLELEGIKPTSKNISERSKELREKITQILYCNAKLKRAIPKNKIHYPLIISLYCADSATGSKRIWRNYMENMLNLLAPKGTILIAALRKCKYYSVGSEKIPSANIDENDLKKVLLKNGFASKNIHISVVDVPETGSNGFTSLMFARADKRL